MAPRPTPRIQCLARLDTPQASLLAPADPLTDATAQSTGPLDGPASGEKGPSPITWRSRRNWRLSPAWLPGAGGGWGLDVPSSNLGAPKREAPQRRGFSSFPRLTRVTK